MRLLQPDALASLENAADRLTFSDVYRSPDSSLRARKEKRGIQRPGYSAHNFGLAIDLAVADCLRSLNFDKQSLDSYMLSRGWRCFRSDDLLGPESWHYTFEARVHGATGVEQAILASLDPGVLTPGDSECQEMLRELRMFGGTVDGDPGPLTQEAVAIFQRAWGIKPTGRLDTMTRRTLAVVTAEVAIV